MPTKKVNLTIKRTAKTALANRQGQRKVFPHDFVIDPTPPREVAGEGTITAAISSAMACITPELVNEAFNEMAADGKVVSHTAKKPTPRHLIEVDGCTITSVKAYMRFIEREYGKILLDAFDRPKCGTCPECLELKKCLARLKAEYVKTQEHLARLTHEVDASLQRAATSASVGGAK